MDKSWELGLMNQETYGRLKDEASKIRAHIERLEQTYIKPSDSVNDVMLESDSTPIQEATSLASLLRRPGVTDRAIQRIDPEWPASEPRVARQVEIQVKYDGYIRKQLQEIGHFKEMDRIKIPMDMDYDKVPGLSHEVREKLKSTRPSTLAKASRIAGMTPAGLSLLLVFLKGCLRKKTDPDPGN
jgi:tRNA uridine 5-carboxymethylaminomethyl modification enzyme